MVKLVIFDWKRTIYDPDLKALIKGAEELLDFIKDKGVPMALVGKGEDGMREEVRRLGLEDYFNQIVFAQGEKDPKVFSSLLLGEPRQNLFIGDRVRSELLIGNKLGALTIWVKQGKFADEIAQNEYEQPDYTVFSLEGCLKLLAKFLQ